MAVQNKKLFTKEKQRKKKLKRAKKQLKTKIYELEDNNLKCNENNTNNIVRTVKQNIVTFFLILIILSKFQ